MYHNLISVVNVILKVTLSLLKIIRKETYYTNYHFGNVIQSIVTLHDYNYKEFYTLSH